MLKHLVHSSSHPSKLHTFDEFYQNKTKPIRTGPTTSTTTESLMSNGHSTSTSPLSSPCSPNNLYTFFDVFSEFKSNSKTNTLTEEDETEEQTEGKQQNENLTSIKSTPLFYIDEDHQLHNEKSTSLPSSHQQTHHQLNFHESNQSPTWSTSIFNRFRHQHTNSALIKPSSLQEQETHSCRSNRTDFVDSNVTKRNHSFLKRAKTIDNPTNIDEKKPNKFINDDFPELSAPVANPVKKHRSFVSLLQHIHHPHQQTFSPTSHKLSDKFSSTGTFHFEPSPSNSDISKNKSLKQKCSTLNNELNSSPISRSPKTQIIPKLVSLFHRNHQSTNVQQNQTSEQYKHRVGNIKARLHHRRMSPSSNVSTRFQCQSSEELIEQIKSLTQQEDQFYSNENLFDIDFIRYQRSVKPVVMKRVHTDIDRQKTNRSIDFKQNFVDRDDDEDDRAFQQFLIEHRNSTNNTNQENQHNQRPKRSCQIRRNSLKDFICDSSSEDDDSDSLYRRVDRLLDEDTLWREQDEKYQSYSSDEYSSKTSSSDDDNDDDGQKPRLTTEKPKTNIDFLESLSNHIPIIEKHPDAKQYFLRSGFKTNKKRQELAEKLFSIFDRDIFSSKLSSKVTIVWSGRLTATAGHCTTRRSTLTATITLSNKVCDSPERCRDTLIHELCHAAVSLIDCVIEHGHGQLWRNWTKKAEKFYPYLPPISVKHTYEVNYKFIYRCLKCKYEVPRHSKSLNVNTDLCGKCLGQFELIINQNQNQNQNQQEKTNQTPKRTPNRYNLFVKEHFQTLKQSQPHLSTPQLMKELGQKYKKKIQEENQIDLPDFDQLKISI